MTSQQLADFVLYLHFAYVLGVLVPIPLILIGGLKGWRWVRNSWFRNIHASMILIVVLESLVGLTCPLTTLEDALRGASTNQARSFIADWVSRIMFYEVDLWVFTVLYLLVAGIIIALYLRFPPPWPARAEKRPS